MAITSPGQTLNNATAAGAGTAVDITGGTAALCPNTISMIVAVTNWTETYNAAVNSGHAAVVVGLEVSMDGTAYVRVGSVAVTGNGNYRCSSPFPARFARATVDTLDSRVSLTLNAYVAGGQ